MAALSASALSDSLPSCTICVFDFAHPLHPPVSLSCGHTLCDLCSRQVDSCPFCRKPHTKHTPAPRNFSLLEAAHSMKAAAARERALSERLEAALLAAVAAPPLRAWGSAPAPAAGALAPASLTAALGDLLREVESLRGRIERGERALELAGGVRAVGWAERGRAAEAAAAAERQRAAEAVAAAERQRAAEEAAAAAAEAERQRAAAAAAEAERQRVAAAAAAEAERQRAAAAEAERQRAAQYCLNCKRGGHVKQSCPFNPYARGGAKRARH
jgi:hypothetical protein